ncbi:hypothetical protein C8T65DRAFT_695620 [Cerioporus squamosus]|nr:hypothetical protein C8T65DRAFT_695620 [Cerioporus squamosus]
MTSLTPSYTRILNNALVVGIPGREPMVARAHVVLAHGSTDLHKPGSPTWLSGWFLIEFPRGHSAEFPFPTFEVNGGDRMVVFQLPLDFEFTYCDDCDFSLVLSQQVDYAYLRGAVAGYEEEDRDTPEGSPAILLEPNIGNVIAIVNEIAAATRDSASVTVRGFGKEGLQGSVITFKITLTGR